jgi:hypothetical protein
VPDLAPVRDPIHRFGSWIWVSIVGVSLTLFIDYQRRERESEGGKVRSPDLGFPTLGDRVTAAAAIGFPTLGEQRQQR